MSGGSEIARMVFTIGHSNHEMPAFVGLLKRHGITAIADVRSQPYSQYTPQFNRETLERVLQSHQILYGFMGRELGARREEAECYVERKARYERIAKLPLFQGGIERICKAAGSQRLTLMCSEKDPIMCHRMVLVCRQLRTAGLEIRHILEDGRVETNEQAEERLLELMGLPAADLFRGRSELVEEAYDRQGEKICYVEGASGLEGGGAG